MKRTFRSIAGTILHDWPRFILCLSCSRRWIRMRNRKDSVKMSPDGRGVACQWEYTRTLHLCDVFPMASEWLLKRALLDYPVRLMAAPEHVSEDAVCGNGAEQGDSEETPQVSFMIGHRGSERLPLLLRVLQSIAAQEQIRFECIVVEQSAVVEIRYLLPSWVRYQHQQVDAEMPYNRSATFNLAATMARAPLLICHDNDMIIPACYGKVSFERFAQGYAVINLKRFIFYLSKKATERFSGFTPFANISVDSVLENATGGGSIGVSDEAFHAIGGFDEDFVGWGGEDVEFWSRCQTRKVWEYTALPIVHLWHPPQAGKRAVRGLGELTAELTEQRLAIAPEIRIENLRRPRRVNL